MKTMRLVVLASIAIGAFGAVSQALASTTIVEQFAALPPFFYDRTESGSKDISKTTQTPAFDPKGYLALAAALREWAKDDAMEKLRELAKRPDGGKTIALCRMLFQAKPGQIFRAPRLGAPDTLPRADQTQWPLEPIAIQDGIPFLITSGYFLNGVAETPEQYLDYCIAECDWSTAHYFRLSVSGFGKNPVPVYAKVESAGAALLLDVAPAGKGKWFDFHWTDFLRKQIQFSASYVAASEERRYSRTHAVEQPSPEKIADFSTRKSTLQKLIAPEYRDKVQIPKAREDDFEQILKVFVRERRNREEFVISIGFNADGSAGLQFTDGGMHGGGFMTFEKKNGQWVKKLHMYFA